MLSDSELQKYLNDKDTINESAESYIHLVRNNDPSRMVGTHAKNNVVGGVTSKKMRFSLSSESRGAEKSFILLSEYDDRVLEIWCQTQPVKICGTNKNGKKSCWSYTADFLVLMENAPVIIEVKTQKNVDSLLISNPKDWRRNSSGDVTYVPAQETFLKIGLEHKVYVYSNDSRYLIANLELMMLSRKSGAIDDCIKKKIIDKFNDSFSWSLYDLKNELKLDCYSTIIQCVDIGLLCFDKYDELLSLPKGCLLARSEELLAVAKELHSHKKIFSGSVHSSKSVLIFPSDKVAKETLTKLEEVKSGKKNRNTRRWKSQIRQGDKNGLTPFQSLVSKRYLSGNKKRRIHIDVETFLLAYLTKEHVKKQGISIYRSYIDYKESAPRVHNVFDPVSLKTFRSWLGQMPPKIVAQGRGGNRLANSVSEPSDPFERSLKPQIAWQLGAIDHYLADIFLICIMNSGEVYVMKPWITAMIDVCTSAVLAVSISFSSPSRNSDAKVIRECVRRHGKLPIEIIIDRGSDFTSVYFVSLLAHYEVNYSFRPAGHSRFGGEIEGLFKEFIDQWLCQKQGNTVDYKNARSFDGKMAPRNKAIIKPYDFLVEFNAYLSWRDSTSRGIGFLSADVAMKENEINYPFVGVAIQYDEEFMLATAVEAKKYKVDFQRGLHVGDMWYWNPDIVKVRGKKSKLKVRLDPENPHVIYALIDNEWVMCASSRINTYSAKDAVSQFVDGLLLKEAASIRRLAKIEADEKLVCIIKEMNRISESDSSVPVIQIDVQAEMEDNESIFSRLLESDIKPLAIERWGGH